MAWRVNVTVLVSWGASSTFSKSRSSCTGRCTESVLVWGQYIQLYHFFSGTVAGVGHVHRNGDDIMGLVLVLCRPQIGNGKGGVAQSESKGNSTGIFLVV